MSDPLQSTHLKIPYLAAAQAQKHVTHNEALRGLDTVVQLSVIDSSLADPPPAPAEGDRYLIAGSATGDWAGEDGNVATFVDGGWQFLTPETGWLAFDVAASALLVRQAAGWDPVAGFLGPVDQFGINTTADQTNRLAVRSNAVLFSNLENASGGTGDIRFVVNKEALADAASLLFQDGFSGRAEVGLVGDDDFVFKVSADGTAWVEAIRIDKATGLATILYDNVASGLTASNIQDAIDEVAAGGGGAVLSVFGRTGSVLAAVSDYDASQIDNDSGVVGATVKAALDTLDGDLSGKQAADGDLTAIAGLAPVNDDIIQRKAGVWTNRTPVQVKADLALVKGDVGLGNVDNTSDAGKPVSTAQQTALDGKLPKGGGTMTGDLVLAGDPDAALKAATKQYVDALLGAQDAMVFKGVIDCSTNPDYPAAGAGHVHSVSVAGKIGGASGPNVEVGDRLLCLTDSTASGDHATVGANWHIAQANIDGAVVGPASVTDDLPAVFDGTTGKLIKSKTYAAFKTLLALVKGDVGLGNVDNTSDASKPVSTATQTALDAKEPADADILKGDVENQGPLTGGARVTAKDLGTVSSGTLTPNPGNRGHQKYTNNGAHTLAPGANQGSYWLDITNAGSAGAITTSGWTKVSGDSFTTTNGDKFACVVHISDLGSLLVVQAMQ